VIEETAKAVEPKVAELAQGIRYRSYELEQAVLGRLGSGRAVQWRLCVILTESACARPWRDVLAAAIDGGADCIQVREKALGGAALARRVDDVLAVARPHGVAAVVNDRPDVALARGADGCHLGSEDLSLADARRLAGRTLVLGASTHDLDEAGAAVAAGADYCGVGSMFPTGTRRAPLSGPAYLEAFLRRHPAVPHLAIGGITPDNVDQLAARGARGVAVCASVCGAARPGDAARRLRRAIDAAAGTERS
jgi:thiamine-phosphate pyrophosphorylase